MSWCRTKPKGAMKLKAASGMSVPRGWLLNRASQKRSKSVQGEKGDGLYLGRSKSGETLMDVRSNSQVDRQT